jgi:hypothetical protein
MADIDAEDILLTDEYPITVFNPTPGGGTTTPLTLAVNYPVPTLTSLSPDNRLVGSGAFLLTVNGASFVPGAIITWNGSDRIPTNFINSTRLTTTIPAAELLAAGTATVNVRNPLPGGGVAVTALTFTINNPVPTVTSIRMHQPLNLRSMALTSTAVRRSVSTALNAQLRS